MDRTPEVRVPRSLRVIFWLLPAMLLLMSSLAASAGAAPTPAASPCQLRGDETTEGADLWAEVAAQVPTFAGMYVDEDSRTLYVLLTDQGQSLEAAVYALQTIVRSPDLCEFTPIALPAKYSHSQLKGWDDRLIQVLSIPGIVSSGIDEAENRLEVGVEDVAVQGPLVEAKLADLNIPREIVIIVQEEPARVTIGRGSPALEIAFGLVLAVGVFVAALARRKRRSQETGNKFHTRQGG